jgi:hypothetical protein
MPKLKFYCWGWMGTSKYIFSTPGRALVKNLLCATGYKYGINIKPGVFVYFHENVYIHLVMMTDSDPHHRLNIYYICIFYLCPHNVP